MKQPYNSTRMTPVTYLVLLVMIGLSLVCEYFNVPLWLTVIVMGTFTIFTITAIERACKPGGWLSDDNGETASLHVGYVSGPALHHISDPEPPEPP